MPDFENYQDKYWYKSNEFAAFAAAIAIAVLFTGVSALLISDYRAQQADAAKTTAAIIYYESPMFSPSREPPLEERQIRASR